MNQIRTILISGSIPTVNQLPLGDIAINTVDGKAYIKKLANTTQSIVELGTGGASISASYALSASYATTASYALNGGVTQLVAGTNVTLSPAGGTGIVTVNAILASSGSGTPNGPIYSLQYNNGGVFSGSGNFTLLNSNALYLTGSLNVSGSTLQLGNNTLAGNTLLSGSITISGSTTTPTTPTIRVYGDMETNGVIKFNPVVKNIDTTVSASYVFVSGSTNDLYFSQNGEGYNNVTRLRWIEGSLYTGLLNGGLITSQSSTVYQVSSGSGIIVNLNASLNNNPFPTIQYLNWGNLSASIAPLSASYDQSFIAINSSTAIEAQGTPYNDGDYNTKIPLGIVIHQNHSTINGVQTFPGLGYGWKQRSFDFIKAFGPLKISGYALTPSGSSTGSLVLSGGTSWVDGRNYTVDPNNPSYIVEATGITTSKIYRYYQSGSDWKYDTNTGAGYPNIDPANYALSGSLTPVGTNDWTIQRVFYFPNSATKAFYIYYGNATYSSKDNAIAGILTEPFTEAPNTAANAIFVGYMILRYNANFTTAASYEFRAGGLFRAASGGGGAGGGGTTSPGGSNTQIQYNNSGVFGGVSTLTFDGSTLTGTGSFSGSFTGLLAGTASWANNATTASYAVNATTASFATTASYYKTFPYTGSALITGSLGITGSTSITSGSLSVYKSGSTVVDIQGSQGQLFSIVDALSGSLMSVNDISGLPILEVFSDDRVVMGTYGAPGLTVSGSKVAASGSFTGSFTGSFLGTASWASNAISSSYAKTGSYVNPLFQPVFISGSTEITGSTIIKGDFTVTSATTIDFNANVFNVNAPTFQVPSFALPYSPSANVRVVMYDAVSNALFVTASAPASAVITNLIATGSITASVQIGPAATVPYFFLVQSGSREMLKINAERVVVFESRTDTPTAVTGGLFYSASGDFFFGM